MAGKYLIDTNAVIDYLDNKLPATGANMLDRGNLHISVITRMELLAWPNAEDNQVAVLTSLSTMLPFGDLMKL